MSTTTTTPTSAPTAWPAGLRPTDLPVIAEQLTARAASIRATANTDADACARDQAQGRDTRTRAVHIVAAMAQASELERLAGLLAATEATGAAA